MEQSLFNAIRDRRKKVQNSTFIKFVANTKIDTTARLSYVPHMLFFIMGFKDMLQELNHPDSTDEIQLHVNEHCVEDNGHWKWFLRDLEHLHLKENFYLKSSNNLCAEMWSDENMPIRRMVYKAMQYCYTCETPAQRMVIQEVIEAIFSVYVESMNILVNQMGRYEDLLFFGRVHHEAESSHSNGNWLDGGKNKIEVEEGMAFIEKEMAIAMVHGLFDAWDGMAQRWHSQQIAYLHKYAKLNLVEAN